MRNAIQIAKDIAAEYAKVRRQCVAPSIICCKIQEHSGESFFARKSGGQILFEASNPIATVQGVSQIIVGTRSSHLNEFLDRQKPRFPLRPLWLTGRLSTNQPDAIKSLCRSVLELGFNAIMLEADSVADLPDLHMRFKDNGIIFILDCRSYFKKIDSLNVLREQLGTFINQSSHFDYLFWESRFLFDPYITQDGSVENYLTQGERVQMEAQVVESLLPTGRQLIFFLPTRGRACAEKQVHWIPEFCDSVGQGTIVAFPCVAGDPTADYLPIHPLWKSLRSSPDHSSTSLMPLLNVGGVCLGGGMWPALTDDIVSRFYPRCYRHQFAGAMAMTPSIPERTSLLSCSLWIAGHAMWHERAPELLAETWFKAFRPDLNYELYCDALREVRRVVIRLGYLQSLVKEGEKERISPEECRAIAEAVLSELKYLQVKFAQERHSGSLGFNNYFTYFLRDARRIVFHFFQCNNIPMTQVLTDDDQGDGFWTNISGGGSGIRGIKVSLLSHPNSGSEGSIMRQIYDSNFSAMLNQINIIN